MASESEAQVISFAAQRAARDNRRADAAPARSAGGRARCSGTTADGAPCRNYAVDAGRCRVHALAAGPGTPRTGAAAGGGESDPSSTGRAAGDRAAADDDTTADRATTDHTAGDPRTTTDRAGTPGGLGGLGRLSQRASRPGRGTDPWFQRAADELTGRGWAPPVDAFGALREGLGDGWLDHVDELLGFLRRRVTGDYDIDEFGFDEDLTTHLMLPLLRPLHRHYWRVSAHGVEHLPTTGGGLLVANHSGTLPADALITRLDVYEHTGRHARELGADLVFRLPFVGELARKTGATLAAGDDADRLLAAGELVAVWPEGFKGVGKPFKDRYKLQRFGRGGFVATALRSEAPIIPTAIVGAEEIYPLLFDLRLVARLLGLPYFPVVAQMLALPVLGPFALLPLPSKWIIEYGEPIDTAALGRELADDPMVVFDLSDQVRATIQQLLYRNLMGRRSVFL